MDSLTAAATRHAADIVRLAIKHDPSAKALIVFDKRTPLAAIITDAYRTTLPDAAAIDFDAASQENVLEAVASLSAGDLVVLIQSSNFQLAAFRFRIELFQRGLAVIEHVHLERAADDEQMATYVDAIAYDPEYYLERGRALKETIDGAGTIVVRCAGTALTYRGGMEPAKLNVGDYTGMKNVGGTFPIGEVFSEPRDLGSTDGEVMIFAFAGTDHLVQIHRPFKVRIEKGMITGHEGPPGFQAVLDQIGSEEKPLVREFGIGLNPAMGKHRVLSDITAFERQLGLHLSIGEKHGVYKKPGFNPKKTHYHIDVFVDFERIEVDGKALLTKPPK